MEVGVIDLRLLQITQRIVHDQTIAENLLSINKGKLEIFLDMIIQRDIHAQRSN